MLELFIFLIGFGFAVTGGVSIIAYLNFLPAGLTFIDYLIFISTQVECYLFIAGFVLMYAAVWFHGRSRRRS
ncbi:hypothetical protein RZN22_02945 [Bacillaceae bacterium S4-13-58]